MVKFIVYKYAVYIICGIKIFDILWAQGQNKVFSFKELKIIQVYAYYPCQLRENRTDLVQNRILPCWRNEEGDL